ncbi:MAG: extracellular solute-binding protein [Bacteroidales bacterium]|nr:extracellular solute-binding protein [Clostridium sp.]MCM1204288.1 extracellular solute-binding protein [Bacteroidales bacterium]
MMSKMRYCKYIAKIFMIGLMLVGCNQKEITETDSFHLEEICSLNQLQEESGISHGEILTGTGRKDKGYFVLGSYEGEDTQWLFYQVQEEEVLQTFSVEVNGDNEIKAFDVDSKGNYYFLKNEYDAREKNTVLVRIDIAAKKMREVSLDGRISEYDTVQHLQLDGKDNLYLFFESGKISVFSTDMEWQYDITEHEEEYILDVARSRNEEIIFVSARYEGDKELLKIYRLDESTKDTVEIMQLEEEEYFPEILINGMGQYDYYVRGKKGICGGRTGEKRLIPILYWEKTDFVPDEIGKLYAVSDERWFALQQTDRLSLIYIVKGKEKKERQILQLACVEADSNLQKEVADFNQTNKDYEIEIISYSDRVNPEQGLIMDLSVGSDFDIVMIPSEEADKWIARNLFVDLYPFLDADSGLKREDFFENLLQAYEWNGKLYQTVSWVHLQCLVTKKSHLEKESEWSLDTFEALLKDFPEAAVYTDASKASVLRQFLETTDVELVDWKKKSCSFNTDTFKRMMELANRYGIEDGNLEPENEIQALRDNRLLFSQTILTPTEIVLYDEALAGDYAVVASPFQEGANIYSSAPQFGIVAKSEKQDAAWQFLRRFFTKPYQDFSKDILLMGTEYVGIPVRKDCFEALLKRYTATQPYEVDGEWFNPYIAAIGNDRYEFEMEKPLTVEQEVIFREIVANAEKREGMDVRIEEIILAEAQSYFSGDKGLEETIEIIQKRVSTYLNE